MREHAVTTALSVSFQRYPCPPSGWVGTLPRSRGALPLAVAAPGRLLLGCPAGEGFWIGLVATRRGWSSRVGVTARLASGEQVDLATGAAPAGDRPEGRFAVPPRFAVEGIARADGGWWALALQAPAPAVAGLELAVWTAPPPAPPPPTAAPVVLGVELVDAAGFEAATGRRLPPPAGEEETYGGWRLP
jgi:hypothetical protein